MSFRETVERLRATRSEPSGGHGVVTRWQGDVSQLYDQIAGWLEPYVRDGGIVMQRRKKAAYEEGTGPYEIEQLDLEVGDEVVRLDPKGAIVIGAQGRVDMSRLGSGEPLLLVLIGAGEQAGWHIVDRTKRSHLDPLTKDAFERALERLLEDYGVRSELPT